MANAAALLIKLRCAAVGTLRSTGEKRCGSCGSQKPITPTGRHYVPSGGRPLALVLRTSASANRRMTRFTPPIFAALKINTRNKVQRSSAAGAGGHGIQDGVPSWGGQVEMPRTVRQIGSSCTQNKVGPGEIAKPVCALVLLRLPALRAINQQQAARKESTYIAGLQ